MAKQRVHHGEPPLSWLWDYYPLARDAWGNVLGFNDGSGDGHTIRMRMWLRAAPMSNFPPPAYRPAQAPLPPMFQDGGSRDCYIPTDADTALVKRLFGDVADAGNPPWPQVEARLIVAGQDRDKLATYNAPTLLLLLAEAEGMNAGGNGGTSARKPGKAKGGRPKVTAAEANTPADAGQGEDEDAVEHEERKAAQLPAPKSAGEHQAEWLGKAMLMVRNHPDWSDAEIARRVGKSPGTLSRSDEYQMAAKLARGSKADRPKGYVTVDPDSGAADVEAVAPPQSAPAEGGGPARADDDRGKPIAGSRYFREYCAECGQPMRVTPDKVGTKPICSDCAE